MRNTHAALVWITSLLEKDHIPYEIDGGLAAHLYGAERALADIDINVPGEHMANIAKKVAAYCIFGPEQYSNEHWHCYMMTLKYEGQEIDICALESMEYFDTEEQIWVPFPQGLNSVRMMEYEGLTVPVINELTLLHYKSALHRGVDRKDVHAMREKLKRE